MRGLFFLIGMALILPSSAMAAEPLSPFVAGVLSRADQAITLAQGLSATQGCTQEDIQRAEKNAAIRRALDPQLVSTLASTDTKSMTLCNRYDLFLIEQKMNDVRRAMEQSIANGTCNLQALTSLSFFSYELELLYKSVREGGLDPSYTDFQLRSDRGADGSPEFIPGDPNAPACPFTTDYAPPSLGKRDGELLRFGCDEATLRFISSQDIPDTFRTAIEREITSTNTLVERARETALTIRTFQETVLTILARLRGKPPPSFPPISGAGQMLHGTIEGCKPPSLSSSSSSSSNIYRVETWERKDLPEGVLLHSIYDSFSAEENTGLLMETYLRVRSIFAKLRALPQDIQDNLLSNKPTSLFGYMLDFGTIQQLQNVSTDHARTSALYLATNTDAIGEMMAAMQPLRGAVKSFGLIASFPSDESKQCSKEETRPQRLECCHYVCKNKPKGEQASCERLCNSDTPLLPSYVRDFALFVRRSCVDGSCNTLLDAVLNRSVNPACYPYGSGCYQRDDYTTGACINAKDSDAPFTCYTQSSSEGDE